MNDRLPCQKHDTVEYVEYCLFVLNLDVLLYIYGTLLAQVFLNFKSIHSSYETLHMTEQQFMSSSWIGTTAHS